MKTNRKLVWKTAIAAIFMIAIISGCKKEEDTGIRPKVTSTDPINKATSIAINSTISAIFSLAMDPATITTANFTLQKGTTAVSGTAAYTGTTATFNPSANLDPNTLYTATITTGAKDISGKSMAKDYVWTFTTGAIPDITLPTVTLTDPANNATGVTLNHLIVVTFSEPMNPPTITSLTFTLKQGSTSVSGAVTNTGTTGTYTPASNLEPNKTYTGTITTGAKDMAGNALASNYIFSFTTGNAPDINLPMVNSTDPLNNAIDVLLNKVVAVTFSEAMDPLTIIGTTFTLKQGATAVSGAVAKSGATATFTPSGDLLPGTPYTATITTSAKDLAGNALAVNTVWTFTTGALPTVISTDPANQATGMALNKKVNATFSTPMDPLTITGTNFTLKQGVNPVAGTVSYLGSNASFTPSGNLLPSTTYTATISTGAKSAPGIPLANDYVWTFTTGALPTVISTDPANQATGLATNKTVTATFSAPMDPLTLIGTTFTVKQGATSVAGIVSYTGTTASFVPSGDLLPFTTFTATITTGAKSLQGIPIANDYVWTFTTAKSPTVTSTDPLNLAIDVAPNKVISATFSVAMNALTITPSSFTLKKGVTSVSGAVNYFGTIATFTPTIDLLSGTTYTATVKTGAKSLLGFPLENDYVWSFTTAVAAPSLAVVDLGAAGNYVILAKTTITNAPTSAVTGDMGLSPAAASFITGFALTANTGYATASQVTGKIYAADMASPTPINLTTAVNNMITAYNDAAGRPTPDFLELGTGNIGGKTLTPGLYKWTNTVTLPSNVTISGSGTDVWIFQIAGNLTVSNAVLVNLIGGALPQNIFWQVAGTVNLGTTSHFEGIILSMTGITLQTGASMKGRALAQTAVILDSNAVTEP